MFIMIFCGIFGFCFFLSEYKLHRIRFSEIIWSRLSRFLLLTTEVYHPLHVIDGGIIISLTPCASHNKGWSKKR